MKLNQHIKELFGQAYILGGSPCSGKSTAAARLHAEFDFQAYNVDGREREHLNRSRLGQHPVMFRLSKMTWNEIWSRPVEQQVAEEFDFYRERFEFVMDDLKQYAADDLIVLEGAAYLPELLARVEADSRRVLYLIPTKTFQLHHYSQRSWIHKILQECDDPEQAFANWMERDHLFGQEVQRQAKEFGFRAITVDGGLDIDETYRQVTGYLGLT
ncbi:MAG: hypothetical protein KDD92_03450 [Caldilineaceae bacterium]|nr:hypothetical protein [Caldilineaceae bacterium]